MPPDLLDPLRSALADRYTIERELGRGGNAVVYLAHDVKHDRKVALKVLSPELALSVRAERFLREIRIAAKLTHPHILPIHDSGEANGVLYYVMPYIEGESLRELLSREKQLPVEDAIRIVADVAAALGHAHGQGVIHRDIKPENILLTRDGNAVVADFGIARAVTVAGGQTVTETGVAVGTPAYMSPEQASGSGEVNARSDIYSLGCVLYEMLVGHPPYTGATAQEILARHALDPVPTISAARPGMPEPVQRAVRQALAKAPVDRFPTATAFVAALSSQTAADDGRRWSRGRKTAAAIAAILVLASTGWLMVRGLSAGERDATWARTIAPREIMRLAEDGKWDSAWAIARSAERLIPDDTTLRALWPRFARRITIGSDPPDATVYRNAYAADGPWDDLGRTPLRQIWIPKQMSRLRVVKEGYDTVEVTLLTGMVETLRPGRASVPQYQLFPRGALPQGMVQVPAGAYELLSPDLLHLSPLDLHAFLIDKYEVTNRDYKEFVLAGGYRDRRYWQEPFMQHGRPLRWEEAMALFVDRTARPGPATWEAGDHSSGREDDPVAGLSWYEAAAYARFRDKSLPTIYHWYKASGTPASAWVVPYSNFGQQGPTRAGAQAGLSEYGTYDMAGNVREWCSNESGGQRYIMGGGWSDAEYMFHRPFALSPWDRSPINGMRLVRYLDPADPRLAGSAIAINRRDFAVEKPVSDAMFRFYRGLFQYDHTPLQPTVRVTDSTAPDWIVEDATFTAAYGDERMRAVLFLPRHAKPPYQTVMFFPGAQALFRRSTDLSNMADIDFIIKSGRAVIYPIYKGTYDRGGDNVYGSIPDDSHAFRDHVIMWAKDLRRSIDYAETRADLDLRKLVYYGRSWGGRQGPIMVAVEPRFQSAVLFLAGLTLQRTQPEVDGFNYASRITVPVLLLSGRYDHGFPLETSSAPLFRSLGTPPEHKRHVVADGGHFVPRVTLVREVLDWLDRYVGPVQPLAAAR